MYIEKDVKPAPAQLPAWLTGLLPLVVMGLMALATQAIGVARDALYRFVRHPGNLGMIMGTLGYEFINSAPGSQARGATGGRASSKGPGDGSVADKGTEDSPAGIIPACRCGSSCRGRCRSGRGLGSGPARLASCLSLAS